MISNNSEKISFGTYIGVPATVNNIAFHWFQERSRQAKLSFNVAVGLAGATAILSFTFAVSVCTGKISQATAAAGLGLTSGAVSVYCFKLSDDANKRLDEAAKELLDDE
jgi:hypothetical protein